ncbi:NUDIX hydrolase [Trypanosoma theileri]|uniref:NUDIX hydrolase n=1 Tax=Trypanosoma theileri TaxID=67003 RepID=A0A1X0P4G7_9TRYP|nr:NUDIX hydrolase [Trypanosoma theileri]ORC91449.1 NUDIX hydrolase [Trypanosoma theileri]
MKRYERNNFGVLKENKFLRLCEVSYRSVESNLSSTLESSAQSLNDRRWEFVQRTTCPISLGKCQKSPVPFAIDGAEICAFLRRLDETFLILVAQYRPPLDAVVVEFPAGLVDPSEDVKHAAIRELREETGYVATEEDIIGVSEALAYEPGLTNSACQIVKILIDGEKEVNKNPKQQLDDGEDIEVILLPIRSKSMETRKYTPLQFLDNLIKEKNIFQTRTVIDAKVYTFLDGISLMESLPC